MRHYWIHKTNKKRLLVFFNGWACDEHILHGLEVSSCDLIILYDFVEMDSLAVRDLIRFLSTYEEVYLLAWSFGIFVAEELRASLLFVSKWVAVNGSIEAVDDSKGIPVRVFTSTLQSLNERNRDKFFMRMMGGKEAYKGKKLCLPQREFSNQQKELESLATRIGRRREKGAKWDKVFLSEEDLIFPIDNLKRAWLGDVHLIKGGAHFPDFRMIINDILAL